MSRLISLTVHGPTDPTTIDAELRPDVGDPVQGFINPIGTSHITFDVPPPPLVQGSGSIAIEAPGFEPWLDRIRINGETEGVQIPDGDAELDAATLIPETELPIDPLPWLPRLVAAGQHLRKDTGERFTAIDTTDFHLTGRTMNGEDLSAVQMQRAALGFTMRRVFTAYDIPQTIGVCKPKDHPAFYADLALLMKSINDYGSYVNLVAFTGNQDTHYASLFANDAEMIDHWEALIDLADACLNVILSLVNEYTVNANHDIPWDDLRRPPLHIMASHGSNGSEAIPPKPFWGFTELHTNGAFEEQRKIAHNAWEIWRGPTLTTETTRWPDKTRRLDVVYGASRAAALLCAGSCFHSVHGKNSTLFTSGVTVNGVVQPGELEAAAEWVRGARSMPVTCQNLKYHHRKDLETAGLLRVYQRGTQPEHLAEILK